MIIGGHFRDFASIHHFHPKAASFGFYSSRCKSTSGFLKCPAFIIAVHSSSRDERHVSPLKHQQKTVRALQNIEPCRTVILRDLWSKPKPLITSMVSLSAILYVLPLLSQVNDTTQPRYQEPD